MSKIFRNVPSDTSNGGVDGTNCGGVSGTLEHIDHQCLFHGRASFHVHSPDTQIYSNAAERVKHSMPIPSSRQGGSRPQDCGEMDGSENRIREKPHVYRVADMTCPRIGNRHTSSSPMRKSSMPMSSPIKIHPLPPRHETTGDAKASESRMWFERLGEGEGEAEECDRRSSERLTRGHVKESRGGWAEGPLAGDAVMLRFPEQGRIKEGAMWVGETASQMRPG